MTDARFPQNVYRLAQNKFEAIPRSPWGYWVSDSIRRLFITLPILEDIAKPKHGLSTGKNFRFVRLWWEIGNNRINFGYSNRKEAFDQKWFPYMKGGKAKRWLGNQEHIVNYEKNGLEMQSGFESGELSGHRHDNPNYYFKLGITYSYLTSGSFNARLSPGGFIFDVAGSSLFPKEVLTILAILNSKFASFILKLLNPTVNFQVGDLARLPIMNLKIPKLQSLVTKAIWLSGIDQFITETSYHFIAPLNWVNGQNYYESIQSLLKSIESQVEGEVYHLYKISDEDRADLEEELVGNGQPADDDQDIEETEVTDDELSDFDLTFSPLELAMHWFSYAIGTVLGRFQPGVAGALGSAIHRSSDFAIGSLNAPDEAEFDELVGKPERFAYIDENGGRHVFSPDVEVKLRALADTDGITVLDEGHPDDLPAKVLAALELMLGEGEAAEVVASATGEAHNTLPALRKFLERDFFTKWHLKWYRKRPVYWLLQSPKKLYGLYLFHERLTRDTLFVIQRQYVDRKLNLTRQLLAEVRSQAQHALSARERRELDKEAEELEKLALDLEEFAQRLKAITDRGYTPHIDDGVILNMAPLHEVIPSWSKEPQKYWQGLEKGEYDWAHLAMDYWPERVRAKCKTNKSLAIAHGHEEWYEGK